MARRSRRTQKPDFYAMLAEDRERLLDTLAAGLAAEQGDAPGTERLTTQDEDYLWHWPDPNATPDLLMQAGEQARQKYGQEANPDGTPVWTPQQVEMAVQAAQQQAFTPYRFNVIGAGRLDPEQVWANAATIRKRHQDCVECQTVAMKKAAMLMPPMPEPMMPPAGAEMAMSAGQWQPATGEEPSPPMTGVM